VRIISGKWKGRRIRTFKGMDVRPTSDKVKEAIFNIIRSRLVGSKILDLFAGTGNLGLEALSRGGLKAVFAEINPRVLPILRLNCENFASSEDYEIIPRDAFIAIKELSFREQTFDLIFIDPPYKTRLQPKVLEAIYEAGLLESGGIAVVEHDSQYVQPLSVEDMVMIHVRKYGNISTSVYRRGQ